ncbi:CoA ester lyase [Enterobacteriaceae bacterium H11S18]|uniref:HpcH/HpaI aldolase/citrate lyase family protein n=1 Tax=Dryocola clanedunensis TaxID=2925396 RepID=UPI0022F0F74A|nr:CoA ester lyase [Dryocola clanedunensis]MCT4712769.1 CoA ester lyase [Dryocola clanedunensis]
MAAVQRSFLFVPGDRPERFEKALNSGADAVIIDLEDAVTADNKQLARQNALAFFASQRQAWVRINALDTPWYSEDLNVIRHTGCLGVLLPKAEEPGKIIPLTQPGKPVLPIIETAKGAMNVRAIAALSGVQRLVFGTLDFSLDTGMADDEKTLVAIRTELVLASRVAEILSPIDGVTTEFRHNTLTATSARHASDMGFGGKLCIHPSQIGVVNEIFSYSAEEIRWAQDIVNLSESAFGALSHNGRMVDKPVLEKAKKILAHHLMS